MRTYPEGTFLVRFSSTAIENFSLDYVLSVPEGQTETYIEIPHNPKQLPETKYVDLSTESVIRVKSTRFVMGPDKLLHALKSDKSLSPVGFKNMGDVVSSPDFSHILKSGLKASWVKQPYWHGEFDGIEAQKLLQHSPKGTFMLRFSNQPRCYAISFVQKKSGTVAKSLIVPTETGKYKLDQSKDQKEYKSIRELIKDYQRRGAWTIPYS